MVEEPTIAVYDSQSHEYHRAFQVFLDHTDQKLKAQKWLTDLIDRLPSRRVFIDAGAGNGKVTAWFTERFGRTITIEPNASLRSELKRDCPAAEEVLERILPPGSPALARSATRRWADRKSTRLNSSHPSISYAVFCLKKKKTKKYAR